MNYHHVTQRVDADGTIILGEDFPELLNAIRLI